MKKAKGNELIFDAIFSKATTSLDGAWKLTFDVNSTEVVNIAKIARLMNKALKLVVIQDASGIDDDIGAFEI